MKKTFISLLILAVALCTGTALADSIDPASFSATLAVGESVTITKTVTVDSAPPISAPVDVIFLADTTGSMSSALNSVKTGAAAIMSAVAGLGDVRFAAAEYKDMYDSFTWKLNSQLSATTSTVQNGIDQWVAAGGGDGPEGQLVALTDIAAGNPDDYGNTLALRDGSTRILVWFGDYEGHNPREDATESGATAALVAANISVEALSVGYDRLDYTGQATRITNATGGHLYSGIAQDAVASAITDAITTAIGTYSSVGLDLSETPVGVSASYDGPVIGDFDRSVERTFSFDLTFTGDVAGVYDFNIYGTVDGGRVATEVDSITVGGDIPSVPEPATMFLLGTSLLGLGVLRRKLK